MSQLHLYYIAHQWFLTVLAVNISFIFTVKAQCNILQTNTNETENITTMTANGTMSYEYWVVLLLYLFQKRFDRV